MRIALACDHAGYRQKVMILNYLKEIDIETIDCGCFSEDAVDYVDTALVACRTVVSGECKYAVLVCGTGIGMSIIANKVKGIRAALCHTTEFAELTRQHNDANVLALSGKDPNPEKIKDVVKTFIKTEFSGDIRHINRIMKISNYENDKIILKEE
jgi:ribose 5-phosphate isomerase B